MFDNMTVNKDGKVILQEDVGNNAHLGKVWEYDPATDQLTVLAEHDPDRFVNGAPNFLTQDEESSGIIDVTDILGSGGQNAYLLDVWTHSTLRRQGIARRMVEMLLEPLRGQHVYLQSDDDTVEFYRHLGFREQPAGMSRVIGPWLVNT